jgi:mono/diheme cytochrome c family protein
MRTCKLHHDLLLAWLAPVAMAGLLSACGGGGGDTAGGDAPAAGGGANPPAAEPAPGAQPEPGAQAPADTPPADTAGKPTGAAAGGGGSAQLIALGDSVFHGQAGGGTCYACHGQDGKGSAVGPNLTDAEWLNTDGTLAGITKTVQSGVPTPKQAPAPMPPMGGASLSPDQVRAVATYVHSLGGGK